MTEGQTLQRIGNLGGMGPEATIAPIQRIHTATLAEDDSDQNPLMVDMNPGTPSRIKHLIEGSGVDPGPFWRRWLPVWKPPGAKALVIALQHRASLFPLDRGGRRDPAFAFAPTDLCAAGVAGV